MENVGSCKPAFAAFTGVTPSQCTSGTPVRGKAHISRKGNKSIRKALYMAALEPVDIMI
ncbi:MAG: transposase [Holosporales bacterium]|nr:transposase [Holosporales bacterium]